MNKVISRSESVEGFSLARLLPTPPSRPPVQVRTLNGFLFWPVSRCRSGGAAAPLRLRRAFEVRPPRQAGLDGGATRCVVVELSPPVRERVRAELRRDLAPDDPLWGSLCRTALSSYLWERGGLPPAPLVVRHLSGEQLAVVRARAAAEPRRCGEAHAA
jgi:hypothetical protein